MRRISRASEGKERGRMVNSSDADILLRKELSVSEIDSKQGA